MAEAMEQFVFVNNYTHAVDAQRRIAIPSEWRKKDGETSFYLLPAKEHIIQLVPKDEWYFLSRYSNSRIIRIKQERTRLATISAAGRVLFVNYCIMENERIVIEKRWKIPLRCFKRFIIFAEWFKKENHGEKTI